MAEVTKWYVVHTYSGYENKVKTNLEKIIENRNFEDLIIDIKVPTEDVIESKGEEKKVVTRKIFPGYVLIKMVMTDETWYVVKNIKGVFNFVGMDEKPFPLTEAEMQSLGISDAMLNVDFEVGDSVTIVAEPFYNYAGVIESINNEKRRVNVKVSMFNRETSVELDFNQIQKI